MYFDDIFDGLSLTDITEKHNNNPNLISSLNLASSSNTFNSISNLEANNESEIINCSQSSKSNWQILVNAVLRKHKLSFNMAVQQLKPKYLNCASQFDDNPNELNRYLSTFKLHFY